MSVASAESVLEFWVDEVGPEGWYRGDAALDQEIRDRFLDTWRAAKWGDLASWLERPESALALLIVLDQFPRNMFRGSGEAFHSDPRALELAKKMIGMGYDMKITEPERQFFYLPLMHSETLTDQDRCVRLILTRMPVTGALNLKHACAHRDVIRRFGRFPYRNEALGRKSSAAEQDYLAAGGYAA